MWKGIRVQDGTLRFFYNEIEDAQYAIDGGSKGTINVVRNFFRKNHIGVRANLSVSNNFSVGVFTQNTFQTVDALNPPYVGQNPHPDSFTYAGVLMRNVDGATLHNSVFDILINGIILDQSTVAIRDCKFSDMQNVNYQEYPNYPRACGIVAIDSDLEQSGIGDYDFLNCNNAGIFTQNSDIVSKGNHFVVYEEQRGYSVTGARFGKISINDNKMEVYGATTGNTFNTIAIFTSLIGDEEVKYEVSNNKIDVYDEALGILSTFNSVNKFSGNMASNVINAYEQPSNSACWFLSTNNLSGNLHIVNNKIFTNDNCHGTGLSYDISTGTSSKIYLIENEFNGNAARSTDGISVSDARGFINYCSNIFTNNDRGLVFEGNSLNSNVMYSTFENNKYGFFLYQASFATFIGEQKHHQNDWDAGACTNCTFEAFATLNANVNLSLFIIDPTISEFTANPVNRTDWFQAQVPEPGDTPPFCSFTTTKIVNGADYLLVNDGNLFSTDDVFAWDKKVYLYQKLAPYVNEDAEAAELFSLLTSQLNETDIKLFDLPFNLEKALSLSSEDKEKWKEFHSEKGEIMNNISNLDKEILDGASHLIAAKIEHIDELTTLDSLENELIEYIDTKRVEKLEAFIVDLNNIVVSQNFKKNEIKYYHALANYLKVKRWKPDFYDVIKKLAKGCYEEDGQAVLKARALLDKCDLQEIEECTENRHSELNQGANSEHQAEVSLFPNPNSGGTLYLNLPSTTKANFCKIIISDWSGKAVLSQQIPVTDNQIALGVSTLNNGVYFIGLEHNGNKVTKKLIIQNK